MDSFGKNRILCGKTKYKQSNRKWGDTEVETKKEKCQESWLFEECR